MPPRDKWTSGAEQTALLPSTGTGGTSAIILEWKTINSSQSTQKYTENPYLLTCWVRI